jgi:hypothetical protein
MKVDVSVADKKGNYIIYEGIEEWDLANDPKEVFKLAKKEYGRCTSKMFIDTEKGPKHIGWVFEKKRKYEDCNEEYLQETWIAPLKKYEEIRQVEYAL